MKFCIDAGHGGSDPGACKDALKEKDVALDIALNLESLLKKAGHDVYMTRVNDVYHTPAQKALIANNTKADYFISIHCNAAENPQAHGTETLVYNPDGTEGNLAKHVQRSLVTRIKTKDRGVKQRKDLAVLNSTCMPAILVETAFISNAEEKDMLMDAKKRTQIAIGICEGVNEFLTKGGSVADKTMEEIKEEVRKKYNFDSNTMLYLEMYRYADELIKRLAN